VTAQLKKAREELASLGDDAGDASLFGFSQSEKRAEFLRAKIAQLEAALKTMHQEAAVTDLQDQLEQDARAAMTLGQEVKTTTELTKEQKKALAKWAKEVKKILSESGNEAIKLGQDFAAIGDEIETGLNTNTKAIASDWAAMTDEMAYLTAALPDRVGPTWDQLKETAQDYALEMAQATGDSLAEQSILHQRFVKEWVDKGATIQQAEALWQAKQRAAARETVDIWGAATKSLTSQWTYVWSDPFSESLNSAQDLFDRFADALDQTWRRMLSAMFTELTNWVAKVAIALGKDAFAEMGFGQGGNLAALLGLGSDKSSPVGAATGALSLASGVKTVAGWLGLDSLFGGGPAILGSEAMKAAELALGSNAAIESAFFGVESASGISEAMANSASLWDFGSQAANYSGAIPGLSATMAPMALATGLGTVGSLISQYNLFGMGYSPMSPEEARERIDANLDFIDSLSKLGGALQDATPYAKDLVDEIDKIAGRAGYSTEQIDAMVASLGPAASELVETARAANQVDEAVQRATDALIASQHDGFAPGAARAQEFAESLRQVAKDADLSERALTDVEDQLFDLAGMAQRGEITIEDMARAFRDDLVEALGSTTEGAHAAADAINRVISLGRGVSQLTIPEGISGGYDPMVGRVASASLDDLGIGSFARGGWPDPGLNLLHPGERVLSRPEIANMGGPAAVDRLAAGQPAGTTINYSPTINAPGAGPGTVAEIKRLLDAERVWLKKLVTNTPAPLVT
jgi:hypothetical protein